MRYHFEGWPAALIMGGIITLLLLGSWQLAEIINWGLDQLY